MRLLLNVYGACLQFLEVAVYFITPYLAVAMLHSRLGVLPLRKLISKQPVSRSCNIVPDTLCPVQYSNCRCSSGGRAFVQSCLPTNLVVAESNICFELLLEPLILSLFLFVFYLSLLLALLFDGLGPCV